jgi:antirestriction protein ArdC
LNVYQEITDKIINYLELPFDLGNPVLPWHRGSSGGMPVNIQSKKPYQGINTLSLWLASYKLEYHSNIWGTYRQWITVDGQVKKGEKSEHIIFYKEIAIEGDNGKEIELRRFLRYSSVFNADQVDGFEDPSLGGDPIDRLDEAEGYVERTGAKIKHHGNRAAYNKHRDEIYMPDEERFTATEHSSRTEAYYSTLLHELTHWSGHKDRLNRDLSGRFGTEAYAMEELVAELGACFQCWYLGISPAPRIDHVQYLKNWLKVLKEDNKAIFTASAKAQEAVTFLGGQHG